MKSKFGMRNKFFSIGMIVFLILFIVACSRGSGYSISGAVSGAIADGITITLTGAATTSTKTTDTNGNYSFSDIANGSYTVTPSLTGYTFNPVSSAVVVSGANVTNTNFVATTASGTTYSISGTVTGAVQANVFIILSGSTTGMTITDANGNYIFSGLANGSYTVTPSYTGCIFTPNYNNITLIGADSPGNNFISVAVAPTTYGISGAVSGAHINGVTITLTGAATTSTTTDKNGNYSFSDLANGNYTVTPSYTGYTFTFSNMAVKVNGASVTNTNFVATASSGSTYSIFGTVTGAVQAGVLITLSGSTAGTTFTNASGNYSFSDILNGTYAVTPSLTGYTFTPSSASVTVSGTNVTATTFVAAE
jgi:hypothetical protein